MISLDMETTGVDFHHGTKPFFVTTCQPDGTQKFWEWDVDPLTRQPNIPEEDLDEIEELIILSGIANNDLILQNAKFDVAALRTICPRISDNWPWERTQDTLIGGHLLCSNGPHDLTSMTSQYLGHDITPLEKSLEEAVQAARRWCRTHHPDWAIAKDGRADMPSSKGSLWRADYWLPRSLYLRDEEVQAQHPTWEHVLRDYANGTEEHLGDSPATLALWDFMKCELRRRDLWTIYQERMKVLPIAYRMEERGVTLSKCRLDQLKITYGEESEKAGRICTNIAAERQYELTLPAGGVNNSLRTFMFDVMNFERIYNTKSRSGAPTLDKTAMEHYMATLNSTSKQYLFVKSLLAKRKRDTAINYMEAYERFWVPVGDSPLRTSNVTELLKVWENGQSVEPMLADALEEAGCDNQELLVGLRNKSVHPQRVHQELLSVTWTLHPSLNPTGTDTLRWSSSNPNEQNISKQEGFNLRYAFGPAPGREWWSLDAKNIEARLPAYLSGERDQIALFEKPDEPPYYGSMHLLNFHTVYPDIWEKELREVGLDKVGPTCKKKYAASYYQWCKNGGFAIQYGCQERKGDATFHKAGAFKLLKQRFSKLAKLNDDCIRYANQHGYVETIPDRTVDPKRGYPLMCTRMDNGFVLPTVPLNYKIQGSAMWWTAKGMIRCDPLLEEWSRKKFKAFIVMQVHDEMVFDLPQRAHPLQDPARSNLDRIRELQALMEQGGDDFGIPTPVGVEYNPDNWSEGVTL